MKSAILQIPAGGWAPTNGRESQVEAVDLFAPLVVREGEVVGIKGRSGDGKSFFVRSIVAAVVEGGDELPPGSVFPATIGYVPQDPELLPECSLSRNLALFAGSRSLDGVREWLPPQLAAWLDCNAGLSPGPLSGGQRRLLALACGIASRNRLLVIDEGLVSLDDDSLRWALSTLRRAVKSGLSGGVLVVSHDERVLTVCDSVYRLSRSRQGRELRRHCGQADAVGPGGDRMSAAPAPLPGSHILTSLSSPFSTTLFRGAVGMTAVFGVLLALTAARFSSEGASLVIPSTWEVLEAIAGKLRLILPSLAWTTLLASVALLGSTVIAAGFWLTACLDPPSRRMCGSVWVALQAVPIAVLSPLIDLTLGPPALDVMIAAFIAVFPIGLLGARAFTATPEDVLLMARATQLPRRYWVSLQYCWGHLVRGVVACSPLAAVGIVVGQYFVSEWGLGALLRDALVDSTRYTYPLAYAFCAAVSAVLVLMLATASGGALLPRDVPLD